MSIKRILGWRCTECGKIFPCRQYNADRIQSFCVKCDKRTYFETGLMTQKETEKYLRRKGSIKNGIS